MREYIILYPDYFVLIIICGIMIIRVIMLISKGGYGDDDKGDDGDEGEDDDPVLDLPPGIDLPLEEEELSVR
ncbi:hypothetical protein [Anditalea andensis]|uniref:Uncharacterized protein n=1 Tax=Anditalea andensis TaxID=1048983 RepID=A0A074KXR9_9BACT|nr:hypothetical protein [Anditalea andensis]KEO73005.1 hypothetical protein EL17_15445 [Anditalea andensis]